MELSKDQQVAVDTLVDWYEHFTQNRWSRYDDIAILKGYAGTGKSTIMAEFYQQVGIEQENILTLATSGMAVKNIQTKSKQANSKSEDVNLFEQPSYESYKPKKQVSPNAMTISSFIKVPHKIFQLNTVDSTKKVIKSFPLKADDSVQSGSRIFKEIEDVIVYNNLAHSKERLGQVHAVLEKAIQQFRQMNQNLDKNDKVEIDVQYINEEFHKIFDSTKYSVPQLHQSVEFLYRSDLEDGEFDIDKRTNNHIKLIVIDEVGMVNQEDLKTILNISSRLTTSVPVLGLGDDNQLPPVKARFNDAILQKPGIHEVNGITVTTAQLTKIHRQDDKSGLSEFAQKFIKRPDGSQDSQNINQALIDVQQTKPNLKDVKYYEFNFNNANYNHAIFTNADAIISWQNKVVRQLNHLVRQYRFQTANPPRQPQVGESIIITQNEKVKDTPSFMLFRNGERFTIDRVYSQQEIENLVLSDGDAKPLKTWVKLYDTVRDYIMLVDLKPYEDKDTVIKKCWINTYLFSNPLVKENYVFNNQHNDLIQKFKAFMRLGIGPKGLINQMDINAYHNSILYATYGYAMTVHKVQGLEFDNVIYYETPWEILRNPSNPAARRYTAITRAKKNLLFMTGNLPR